MVSQVHKIRLHFARAFGSLRAKILVLVLCATPMLAAGELVRVDKADLTMNKELSDDVHQALFYMHFGHFLPTWLNDDYSSRVFDSYLELLDPRKTYFTQADITSLGANRYKIDDLLLRRDAEIGFDIFKLYRQRVEQRTKAILKLINSDFDFTQEESLNIDYDNRAWASTTAQLDDMWHKLIKNDVLQQLIANIEIEQIRDNLTRRYQRQLDLTFQFKADEVFELFMRAVTSQLDPHTLYMSHATTENFLINMSLSLQGIGAVLQSDDGYTVINRIITGGPADKSQLIHADDKIIGVGQENADIVNVIGWRLSDVVRLIRGDKGSKVRLQLIQADQVPGAPSTTIELVRDVIQLEDQAAALSYIETQYNKQPHKFAVINIPSFYSNYGQAGVRYTATTHDVRKLLKDMQGSGAEGLVIDLRGNSGGLLDEAVSLTGLFIKEGPIVQVVQSRQQRQVLNDPDHAIVYDGPLVVLIDRQSSSASEIFAAALQDYGRAVIVGERSFGKGTVQRVTPLRHGNNVQHQSQIKFTNAQFFRINGGSTQLRGVTPDVLFNINMDDQEYGERAYDNPLPWSQTQATNYQAKTLPSAMFDYLNLRHQARSQTVPAFVYLRQNSAYIAQNKDIKELSLVMQKRQAQYNEREQQAISQLNGYRTSLGLAPVTAKTRKDNPLPDKDEHWNIVYHTEAARILLDMNNWAQSNLANNQESNQATAQAIN